MVTLAALAAWLPGAMHEFWWFSSIVTTIGGGQMSRLKTRLLFATALSLCSQLGMLAAQDFGLANVEYTAKSRLWRISFAATRLIEESDPAHAWLYGHCRLTARAPVTDAGISDPFRD